MTVFFVINGNCVSGKRGIQEFFPKAEVVGKLSKNHAFRI